jgi:hypothetical protein
MKTSKGILAGFWISTALFALQISFTAYAQLRLAQVAAAFAHLDFPAYFRIELSWAMVPARLKEWAYAGFAITLVSALIAHQAGGDGINAWGWAGGTGALWSASYYFWRRVAGGSASAGVWLPERWVSARSPPSLLEREEVSIDGFEVRRSAAKLNATFAARSDP